MKSEHNQKARTEDRYQYSYFGDLRPKSFTQNSQVRQTPNFDPKAQKMANFGLQRSQEAKYNLISVSGPAGIQTRFLKKTKNTEVYADSLGPKNTQNGQKTLKRASKASQRLSKDLQNVISKKAFNFNFNHNTIFGYPKEEAKTVDNSKKGPFIEINPLDFDISLSSRIDSRRLAKRVRAVGGDLGGIVGLSDGFGGKETRFGGSFGFGVVGGGLAKEAISGVFEGFGEVSKVGRVALRGVGGSGVSDLGKKVKNGEKVKKKKMRKRRKKKKKEARKGVDGGAQTVRESTKSLKYRLEGVCSTTSLQIINTEIGQKPAKKLAVGAQMEAIQAKPGCYQELGSNPSFQSLPEAKNPKIEKTEKKSKNGQRKSTVSLSSVSRNKRKRMRKAMLQRKLQKLGIVKKPPEAIITKSDQNSPKLRSIVSLRLLQRRSYSLGDLKTYKKGKIRNLRSKQKNREKAKTSKFLALLRTGLTDQRPKNSIQAQILAKAAKSQFDEISSNSALKREACRLLGVNWYDTAKDVNFKPLKLLGSKLVKKVRRRHQSRNKAIRLNY